MDWLAGRLPAFSESDLFVSSRYRALSGACGGSRLSRRVALGRQKVQAKSLNRLGISVALIRHFSARRGGIWCSCTNRNRRSHDRVFGHLDCFTTINTPLSSPYVRAKVEYRAIESSTLPYRIVGVVKWSNTSLSHGSTNDPKTSHDEAFRIVLSTGSIQILPRRLCSA